MPYTRFVKTKKGVAVYKKSGGREVKAFTAHTQSVEEAKKIARIRERHARRKGKR